MQPDLILSPEVPPNTAKYVGARDSKPPVCFAAEPLESLWEEALPLLCAHWMEVAHYQDIPLDPDLETYRTADQSGMVRAFTVRDATDRLLGYALYFVRLHPHYRSAVQAVQDVIYITPEARGSTGYRFIKWCDEQLKAEGVRVVYQHVKAAHNFGPMLERQGYEVQDIIYSKRLDR